MLYKCFVLEPEIRNRYQWSISSSFGSFLEMKLYIITARVWTRLAHETGLITKVINIELLTQCDSWADRGKVWSPCSVTMTPFVTAASSQSVVSVQRTSPLSPIAWFSHEICLWRNVALSRCRCYLTNTNVCETAKKGYAPGSKFTSK